MTIKGFEEVIIYESPDGGKTVYSRKMGEAVRQLNQQASDPVWLKEQELTQRWVKLKEAVMMDDPTINDLIDKIEMLAKLKK
jgi:hypothetical protein